MEPDTSIEPDDAGPILKVPSSNTMHDKVRTKLNNFMSIIFEPTCPYSLGVVRILFGLMMVIDIPDERGLHIIDERFGDPLTCHFPLFHWWTPLPFEYMGLLYFFMWLGAAGMSMGFFFKTSCLMFVIPYWYIFLLDKTMWNNHSYLFGLVSFLFLFTSANNYFSIDALLDPTIRNKPVPRWNYWIIRFQFFLLYFYAGLKKMDPDWIFGYSMTALGEHWVFDPFRLVLTTEQIDLWIIHIFGFLFDLTVGFWLLWDKTRPLAMFFSTNFHLMNSRMFDIGQFPYVCLVTTPVFCSYDWPCRLKIYMSKPCKDSTKSPSVNPPSVCQHGKLCRRQKLTCGLLGVYVALQLFLPYSHSLTPGYNNWTNGLYGYSWDMMVHSWDTTLITVTVKDKTSGRILYLDPEAWVANNRYSKHADTAVQYAACVKRNLAQLAKNRGLSTLQDVAVYLDVWSSLNKRFQQRMIDPKQDLITADWSPLRKTTWLLPLLTDLTPWRGHLLALQSEVYNRSNNTDILFVADFPGMTLEHFVREELLNVSLTVLQGSVDVEIDGRAKQFLIKDSVRVKTGQFHQVYTKPMEPSCIMYTYQNASHIDTDNSAVPKERPHMLHHVRLQKLQKSFHNLWRSFSKIAANFGVVAE